MNRPCIHVIADGPSGLGAFARAQVCRGLAILGSCLFSRRLRGAILAGIFVLLWQPLHAADSDYRLNVGDLLRVAVSDRQEISGDYRIGLSGDITLPLIGRVPAAGLRPENLESQIIDQAQRVLRLIGPLVVVEILEYRPLYVLGDVNNPGKFPYTSRISVLQAIALAGGRRQIPIDQLGRQTKELLVGLIEARRDVAILSLEYAAALARTARLESEKTEAAMIEFPPELRQHESDPRIAEMMDIETNIFESRRQALQAKTEIQTELIKQFQAEVKALQSQANATRQALGLLDEEIALVSRLESKGLAPKTQLLEIKRSRFLATIEQRGIEVSITETRQAIAETRISILDERNTLFDDILLGLEEARLQVSERRAQLTAARDVLRREQEAVAAFRPDLVEDYVTNISIVRDQGAGPRTLAAAETTEVLPGDIVRVERTIRSDAWPGISIDESQSEEIGAHAQEPAGATN